jgi:hypothetical protein
MGIKRRQFLASMSSVAGMAALPVSAAVEEFRYNADGTIPFVPQTEAGPVANPSPGCAGAQKR